MQNKDAVIVGQGPAGVSAALYLQRAGLQTVLVGGGPGGLAKAERIDNYYGLPAISGSDLHAAGVAQARALGAELAEDQVVGVEYDGAAFTLVGSKDRYTGRAILFATGAARVTPPIPGLKDLEGQGVSYCAVCDGFFYRGREVAVLGNGDYALHEAGELLPLAARVTLLTDGKPAPENLPDGLAVDTRPIDHLEGSPLQAVHFKEGDPLPVAGLFVALGVASAADLAKKIGIFTEGQYIKVNEKMETNFPGIYAAGDCVGGLLQVAKAVGEGAVAGTAMVQYLRKK